MNKLAGRDALVAGLSKNQSSHRVFNSSPYSKFNLIVSWLLRLIYL